MKLKPQLILRLKAILACYVVVQIAGLLIGIAAYLLTGELYGGPIRFSDANLDTLGFGVLIGFLNTVGPTAIYAIILGLLSYQLAPRAHAYKALMLIGVCITLSIFFIAMGIMDNMSMFDRDSYDPQLFSMIYTCLIAGALGSGTAVWICRRALQAGHEEWA